MKTRNNLTAAEKNAFTKLASKLTAKFEAGEINLVTFVQTSEKMLEAYLTSLNTPKVTKATSKTTYRVRDLTSFVPAFLGDLYPTRAAAESFVNTLPFTKQLTTEVVAA